MRCDWYGCWREATVYVDVLAYCSPHARPGFGTWPARRFIELTSSPLLRDGDVMGSGMNESTGSVETPRPADPSSVPEPAGGLRDLPNSGAIDPTPPSPVLRGLVEAALADDWSLTRLEAELIYHGADV